MNDKIKIKNSYCVPNKPSYKEWVKMIGIKEMAWLHHPDGKKKADNIMENVGIPAPKTFLEHLLGK